MSALAPAGAFASFALSSLDTFVRFGLISAFGVLAALVLSFSLLPLAMSRLRHDRRPHGAGRLWSAALGCLVPLASRRAGPILAACAAALAFFGYGWLALGLILLGLNGLHPAVPASAAMHALTVGAIGTMILAVMTRATLGHTGRPLRADGVTVSIYGLITAAALLRLASPLAGAHGVLVTSLAGAAWTAAFATFAVHYGRILFSRARPG